MNEAIEVLEKAEGVLMKRIREMRDGKPKYAANHRLNELRDALKLIKANSKQSVSEEEVPEFYYGNGFGEAQCLEISKTFYIFVGYDVNRKQKYPTNSHAI